MLSVRWLVELDIPTPNVLHTLFNGVSNRILEEWLAVANEMDVQSGLSVMTNATWKCRGSVCSKFALRTFRPRRCHRRAYKVSYPSSWRLRLQQETKLSLRVALGGKPMDLHGKVRL